MSAEVQSAASAGSAMSSVLGLMNSVKEKWETSGGSEVVSRVSSSIPQGTKDYLHNAGQQVFNRNHLRSVTVFFGIGEERAFYLERSPSLLMARLQHNMSFFYLNYMLVFAILFLLTMITSMTTMIGIGLLGAAWLYVIRSSQDGGLKIYSVTVSQKQATIGMSIISIIVLLYLLSHIFWWTAGSGGLMVGVHAFFRDASMHQDQEDQIEMSGDLSLEENASFLNPVEGQVDSKV